MLKFSKSKAINPLAEKRIDEYFAAKLEAVLGHPTIAAVHARKRLLVQNGIIPDDGIITKANAQDEELLRLDVARREYKARIRAATTSDEILAILKELDN